MKYFLVILCLFLSRPLLACTCFGAGDFETEYNEAQVVVEGKVTGRKIIRKRISNTGGTYRVTYLQYTIRPRKTYKGQPTQKVRVITAHRGATCGARFNVGRYYIVYGFQDDKLGLITSRCNRNVSKKSERYVKEIKLLEEAQNSSD